MANKPAHIATAPDGTEEGVIAPFYFCLEGSKYGPGMKPGRTWRLSDRNNPSVTAICKSTIPIENEIHVRIEIADQDPLEHTFSRKYDGGLTLTLKKSLMQGSTWTWGSGLQVPTGWKLGKKIEITSLENDPITHGPLKLSAMFRRFRGGYIPIPGDNSDQDEKVVIQVDQKIIAVKTGLEIANMNMFFGLGVGIIGVDGRVLNRNFKYRLDEFFDN